MEGHGWQAALSSPAPHSLAFGAWGCESGFYTQLARSQHGQKDSLAVPSRAWHRQSSGLASKPKGKGAGGVMGGWQDGSVGSSAYLVTWV